MAVRDFRDVDLGRVVGAARYTNPGGVPLYEAGVVVHGYRANRRHVHAKLTAPAREVLGVGIDWRGRYSVGMDLGQGIAVVRVFDGGAHKGPLGKHVAGLLPMLRGAGVELVAGDFIPAMDMCPEGVLVLDLCRVGRAVEFLRESARGMGRRVASSKGVG